MYFKPLTKSLIKIMNKPIHYSYIILYDLNIRIGHFLDKLLIFICKIIFNKNTSLILLDK